MSGPTDTLDVLVIGAGQAGLAVGYHLNQRGLRFLIVDAASEAGASWRRRWDSLRLFTPAQYDSLPGLPFPADHDSYPGKDDVAEYLHRYAAAFDLPIRLSTPVISLTRELETGCYLADIGSGVLRAQQVVVATGPFQVPSIPAVAARLDPGVTQLHSSAYRNPGELPAGRVLVVGAGNSGCQIGAELSATREVLLSAGSPNPVLPQRLLRQDVWWWARGLGFDRVTAGSRLGRRLAGRDPVFGGGPRRLAQQHGVRVHPRLIRADGQSVTFQDGATTDVAAVVWATGYRADHSWIDVRGAADAQGRLQQVRGATPIPGLYTVGLVWQHTRGSALLGCVGADAAFIADQITRNRPARTAGGIRI
jgi:putative flavoprotein involved in K+ transport